VRGADAMSALRGLTALLLTTLLWGSSFPVIKLVVVDVGGFRYVWVRGLVAFTALTPLAYTALKRGSPSKRVLVGGFATGVVYSLGLLLQGVGTGLTTASNSAFITGLNVVFVHMYVAVFEKRYSPLLGLELLLAVTGLYLLTTPMGGFSAGDFFVLASAIAWAAQVVMVSKYGGEPFTFTWMEMLPSLAFAVPDLLGSRSPEISTRSLLGLAYLGVACSAGAFTLQVYGQRFVLAEVAALIYLLEPVFASFFAWLVLGEVLTAVQAIGAVLILAATILATRELVNK